MTGLLGALVQRTQSLFCSCRRMALIRSCRVLKSVAPSSDWSRPITADAVVARNVDREAEKVTAGEFRRWCSTIPLRPVQKPPPVARHPAKLPTNMSIWLESTFCSSVKPLPVWPKTPYDQLYAGGLAAIQKDENQRWNSRLIEYDSKLVLVF